VRARTTVRAAPVRSRRLPRAGWLVRAAAWALAATAVLCGGAFAHDAGIVNGVFRSRDGGATWLQVNAESFSRGALALALHPRDPHHLLLATDSGLFESRNGGLDWAQQGPSGLAGPVFAVAFDATGGAALASGARALYRLDDGHWRETRTPSGAAPARALVAGGVAERVYLAGWSGLFRSENGGRSWTRVAREIGEAPVTALAVSAQRPDEIHALAAGNLWSSADAARSWRANSGAPQNAQALAFDRTHPTRLWLVSAGRLHRQDDRAAPWQPVGTALPDAQAAARGIDVHGGTVVVATDRGVFRSTDAGASWTMLRAELPDHAEAALLLHDPHASATLYAGFSRTGIEALQAVSPAPDPSYAGGDVALAVGAYAGFALLLLGTGLAVRRLMHAKAVAAPPTLDESLRPESPR